MESTGPYFCGTGPASFHVLCVLLFHELMCYIPFVIFVFAGLIWSKTFDGDSLVLRQKPHPSKLLETSVPCSSNGVDNNQFDSARSRTSINAFSLRSYRTTSTSSLQFHSMDQSRDIVKDRRFTPAQSDTRLSFTCFAGLPIELQLEIWRFALPCGRIVALSLWRNFPNILIPVGTTVRYEPMTLLHTCCRSRIVAQRFYKLVHLHRTVPFYLSASNDILLIQNIYGSLKSFCGASAAGIRGCVSILAIKVYMPLMDLYVAEICDTVKKIGSLKALVILFVSAESVEALVLNIQRKLLEMQKMDPEDGDNGSEPGNGWRIPEIRVIDCLQIHSRNYPLAIRQMLVD